MLAKKYWAVGSTQEQKLTILHHRGNQLSRFFPLKAFFVHPSLEQKPRAIPQSEWKGNCFRMLTIWSPTLKVNLSYCFPKASRSAFGFGMLTRQCPAMTCTRAFTNTILEQKHSLIVRDAQWSPRRLSLSLALWPVKLVFAWNKPLLHDGCV